MESVQNFTFIEGHINEAPSTSMKNRMSPMIKAFIEGEDVLLLAQSGSELGHANRLGANKEHNVIRMVAKEIFKQLQDEKEIVELENEDLLETKWSPHRIGQIGDFSGSVVIDYMSDSKISCRVSFIELHKERMYDILEPLCGRTRKRVFVGTAANGNAFIKGVKESDVTNEAIFLTNVEFGQQNLQEVVEKLNYESSQSHLMIIFKLKDRRNNCNADISTLTICDLAYCTISEESSMRSNLAMGADVSLLALKRCLEILQNNQSLKKRFPLKKSILTRLCSEFFKGKGLVTVLYDIEKPLVKNLNLDNALLKAKIIEQNNQLEGRKHALEVSERKLISYQEIISQQAVQLENMKRNLNDKVIMMQSVLTNIGKMESSHEQTAGVVSEERNLTSEIKFADETNMHSNIQAISKRGREEPEEHERPSKRNYARERSAGNMEIAVKLNEKKSQTRMLLKLNLLSTMSRNDIEATLNDLKEDNETTYIVCFQNYQLLECPAGKVADYYCYSSFDKNRRFGIGLMSKIKPLDVFYGVDSEDSFKFEIRVITAKYDAFYVVYMCGSSNVNTFDEKKSFFCSFKDYLKRLDPTKKTIVCGNLNYNHGEIQFMKVWNGFRVLTKAGCAFSFQELKPQPDSAAYCF